MLTAAGLVLLMTPGLSYFYDGFLGRKPSALAACIGAVVGLVAITPAAGFVSVQASVFIGVFAAGVSNFAVAYKARFGLDDTLFY
jgi:ammonium transporter, Amt family